MTKKEMISKIYENIADKTLSFGCNVNFKILNQDWTIYWFDFNKIIVEEFEKDNFIYYKTSDWLEYNDDEIYEIIWHPVMIWDVLDYIEKNIETEDVIEIMNTKCHRQSMTIFYFKEKRKPIEEQLDDCIEYIYNLIK